MSTNFRTGSPEDLSQLENDGGLVVLGKQSNTLRSKVNTSEIVQQSGKDLGEAFNFIGGQEDSRSCKS